MLDKEVLEAQIAQLDESVQLEKNQDIIVDLDDHESLLEEYAVIRARLVQELDECRK